jgi:hypothetical protein
MKPASFTDEGGTTKRQNVSINELRSVLRIPEFFGSMGIMILARDSF